MSVVNVVSFSVVCTCLLVLLRRYSSEFAIPVSVVSCVIILAICAYLVNELFDDLEQALAVAQISAENFKLLFKSLGICYITQLGKDICVDAGETALGEKVDLFGKIVIVSLSVPLILEIIELIKEVLSL